MAKRRSKEEFVKQAKELHGNKNDYSNSNFEFMTKKINIKCLIDDHGEFEQLPYAHLNGQDCPKCGIKKMTQSQSLTTDEFIKRSIEIHGNRYGYEKAKYINNQTKVIITCFTHGEFLQTPANHMLGRGCPKCKIDMLASISRFDTEIFIQKAKTIHGDKYDYSKAIYINAITPIIIICHKHGEFKQLPYVHLLGFRCPSCKESKGEALIAEIFKKNNINFKRQYRIPEVKEIYFYDFYLPDYNLLIEFHGIQHYKFIYHFHRTKEKFLKRLIDDKKKKEYADIYRYKFLCLKYILLEKTSIEEFENKLMQYINKL